MSLETSLAVGLVSPGSFVKLGLFSFDLYFFPFGCFLSLQIWVVNSVLGKHYRQETGMLVVLGTCKTNLVYRNQRCKAVCVHACVCACLCVMPGKAPIPRKRVRS